MTLTRLFEAVSGQLSARFKFWCFIRHHCEWAKQSHEHLRRHLTAASATTTALHAFDKRDIRSNHPDQHTLTWTRRWKSRRAEQNPAKSRSLIDLISLNKIRIKQGQRDMSRRARPIVRRSPTRKQHRFYVRKTEDGHVGVAESFLQNRNIVQEPRHIMRREKVERERKCGPSLLVCGQQNGGAMRDSQLQRHTTYELHRVWRRGRKGARRRIARRKTRMAQGCLTQNRKMACRSGGKDCQELKTKKKEGKGREEKWP